MNAAGFALIKEYEGFRAFPYPDPASKLGRATSRKRWGFGPARDILRTLPDDVAALSGHPWTQGYGFTRGVTPDSSPITIEQAESRLRSNVVDYQSDVERLLTREPTENELAAMVSLAWNIGITAFSKSTVLRCHNAGDHEGAARAFGLFNKAGKKVERGLVARRSAESTLYLRPDIPTFSPIERDPMPQMPDPERPMYKSSIVQAGSLSGGVAGVTLAAEGARAVGEIRYSLGDWLPYIALGIVFVAAVIIVWERLKQRKGGWA